MFEDQKSGSEERKSNPALGRVYEEIVRMGGLTKARRRPTTYGGAGGPLTWRTDDLTTVSCKINPLGTAHDRSRSYCRTKCCINYLERGRERSGTPSHLVTTDTALVDTKFHPMSRRS